ncbi:hypothetical protein DFJ58DRAFT_718773 [Suillus subalutaceus]|uniref:uncharacterized protein n=1 Tax=Suillus subalutaceus TaxID=48586 RepID=UPI001B86AD7D|nr:uncharacterized protein DFJ58DRAFT_718773 [Suillus subalutaceus]KAG1838189.1 hypothetical protein DFJ58DRAFT_718773 [Suillus subalutaceus]
MILTEVHLLECCIYRGIVNLSKPKAALTSARTVANLMYRPPHLQADKGYTTTYSYSYENFEDMSSQDDPAALNVLKHMLLCKVMLNVVHYVTSLLSSELRNLSDFEEALRDYKHELSSDPTIHSHLVALYDTLLQQNLLRIIEPYSAVEIDYIVKQVGQGRQDVEAKLCQMILDKMHEAPEYEYDGLN